MGATAEVRRRCRLATEPHRDRGVTLHGVDGRTYHAIDATEDARDRLADLRLGDAVEVVLEPVRCRGDGWRITRLRRVDRGDGPAGHLQGTGPTQRRPSGERDDSAGRLNANP
ncbi:MULTISPECIES: hypothetical protein [unclassified Halorubrum]|jgi:hypothetical protein|uniref:hypothetical protein n=1 Tax=unclassified Halorubrum TaxID=2642239 RepID=UPI000EF1EAF2|nr:MULTISPECIES: hypothetical protein [unclassified Halorubrum]RLM52001.1 hypothetical protein DVK06_00455 [Halorubrum sp. Atlit-28R]TKX45976.1 hypothetical protein EXE50_01870 [Halorubrum sp. ARQ200]